jgi:hypothetical protein
MFFRNVSEPMALPHTNQLEELLFNTFYFVVSRNMNEIATC